MNHFKMTRFSYLLVIALATLLLGARTVKAMTPLSCGVWTVVSSPNPGLDDSLLAVAAVPGTSQFWAVGKYDNNNGFFQTVAERWNGTQWSVVASPNVQQTSNELAGVAVVSANDVWAVGQSGNLDGTDDLTLTEHWNGSLWQIVRSPNPTAYSHLNAVASSATNDVWAVGYYLNSQAVYKTLIEHWDGTSWSIVASPNPKGGQYTVLNAVTVVSANDVWAVGEFYNPKAPQQQTLVEHWDGTRWSIVASPSLGKGGADNNYLTGAAVVSANDVWAVGSYYIQGGMQANNRPNLAKGVWTHRPDNSTRHGYYTLIEHWDGTRWSVVPSPSPGEPAGNPRLYAVAAISASDVWAVGWLYNPNSAALTLILHWNGSKWSVVPSPSPGGVSFGDASVLYGVAATSAHNVQSVGYYQTDAFNPTVTLVESFC